MYTPPGRARAVPPPRARGDSPVPQPDRPGRGAEPLTQGRGRHTERVELLDQALDPGRIRLSVHPVDRRHALALEQLGHLFVGEDHQPLDQPVRLGLLDAARSETTLPAASKRNSGSKDSTSRLVAPRCSPSAAAPPRAPPPATRPRPPAAPSGRRRPGRAGRSRGGRRSGCCCDRSWPNGACRRDRARSRRSPRAARLRAPGCRRPRSELAAASARPSPARRCCWPAAGPRRPAACPAARGRRRRRCGSRGASRRPRPGRRQRRRSRAPSPDRS